MEKLPLYGKEVAIPIELANFNVFIGRPLWIVSSYVN